MEFWVSEKKIRDGREGCCFHIFECNINREIVLKQANKFMKRLELTGVFKIVETNFDDNLLALAEENKLAFRSLTDLNLIEVNWTLTIEASAKSFRTFCPKMRKLTIYKCRGSHNFVTTEILRNRNWDKLCIKESLLLKRFRDEIILRENAMLEKCLDDDFLTEVVANTKEFSVPTLILYNNYYPHPIGTTFTLHGVVNMLNKCSVNGHCDIQHDLGVVELGNVPFENVENYILAIPDTKVMTDNKTLTKEYTVTFDAERKSNIRFEIFTPRE